MKHPFAFVTAALAVTLATPVAAQRTVRAQPDIALQAEHQVWQAEHDRWEGEHRTAAQRLRAIAERPEKPEGDALSRHRAELDTHGAALNGRPILLRSPAHMPVCAPRTRRCGMLTTT